MNLTPVIKESFLQFGGAVLQSRALPDARDILKPSTRQIFYCLYTDKFVHEKPFQKTLKAIGSAFRMYIHGDSSAEGIIMRAGQPFAMRYPLVEVEGASGTIMESNSWSAPRYTSARLSRLANYLFADINKDVISEWRDNYDDTEQYPMVLPSKGYYNIVNGSYGIGVGASCSIPQYNLRELNEALIKLLWNPDISFDEIYCAPDFATGAIILNEKEVKESHRNGTGAACKLRSVIEFDAKERCLIVKEIPYMVYTNTICKQLEEIVNSEENPGIDRPNAKPGESPIVDSSTDKPYIQIYLGKKSNPDQVIKYLYKNTSLQSHYGVNFTVLENGRYPKVFTWKQLLQAHLDHEREVYIRGFEFDLKKIRARIHIIEGLLKAYDAIDEVVQTIKTSASSTVANEALRKLLGIDEIQAKAILDLKLARLSKLDINKLCNEKSDLEKEETRIESILNDDTLLKKEIENGLREVAEKFGDARRTKILNLQEKDDEVIEVKRLSITLTNQNAAFVDEVSSLYAQRRNGVGSKFKLDKGEFVVDQFVGDNTATILFFTNKGTFYHKKLGEFAVGEKQYLNTFFTLAPREELRAACILDSSKKEESLLFVTKNGIAKRSLLSEYNLSRAGGVIAITLDAGDEIVSVLPVDKEPIGILSYSGNFIMINSSEIRSTGRATRGVVGMKLDDGDFVTMARRVPKTTKEILSIAEDGLTKKSPFAEFSVTGRGTKGRKIQKTEACVDFLPIENEKEIIATSTSAQIKIALSEIPTQSRGTMGVKVLKMKDSDKIIKISAV